MSIISAIIAKISHFFVWCFVAIIFFLVGVTNIMEQKASGIERFCVQPCREHSSRLISPRPPSLAPHPSPVAYRCVGGVCEFVEDTVQVETAQQTIEHEATITDCHTSRTTLFQESEDSCNECRRFPRLFPRREIRLERRLGRCCRR